MLKNLSKDEALVKMQNICSVQEKCISDVQQKLRTLKINNSDISEIIDNLIDNKYINELIFATSFTNDKIRLNKWGLQKIKYELKSKRISDSDIAKAFTTINQDEYNEMQISELHKKLKTLADEDKQKTQSKLFNFAQSRGYDISLIKKIIDKNLEDE